MTRFRGIAMNSTDLSWRRVIAEQLRTRARIERLAFVLGVKFDPNQPRKPAGKPDGGQWMKVDGPVLAQGRGRFRGPPPSAVPRIPRRSAEEARNTPIDDITAPGGQPIGAQFSGARPQYRTLDPVEFAEFERQMMQGAERLPDREGFLSVFRRRGGEFAIRDSADHGRTIDIFTRPGAPNPPVRRVLQW
jgi:hypothetical protein